MEHITEPLHCTGCGACLGICPRSCISFAKDAEGFICPQIDRNACTDCRLCRRVCPSNREMEKNPARFYMAWHRDEEVLKKSSSGGMMTAIAEYVLKKGGVVFGAAFHEQSRKVRHIGIERTDELEAVRLSKYYQSDTGDTFREVRLLLEKGRAVLYTGTGCQIAGLKAFLSFYGLDRSELLLTAEVLCHGCVSKKMVDHYIRAKEKRHGKEISSYRFRVKPDDGWQSGGGTRMRLDFLVIEDKGKDTFFIGFNRNYYLREACYRCRYTGEERIADFTLADFWGVRPERVPEGQMKRGVSLLLANSDRAEQILAELKEDIYLEKIDKAEAIPYNLALVRPNARPGARSVSYRLLSVLDFDAATKLMFYLQAAGPYLRRRIVRLWRKGAPGK